MTIISDKDREDLTYASTLGGGINHNVALCARTLLAVVAKLEALGEAAPAAVAVAEEPKKKAEAGARK